MIDSEYDLVDSKAPTYCINPPKDKNSCGVPMNETIHIGNGKEGGFIVVGKSLYFAVHKKPNWFHRLFLCVVFGIQWRKE